MRKIADPKYDVNFFPVVDRERELPVYAVGIGAGHEQEELTIGNWMGINVLHLHMTVSGCGIIYHEGKRYILPIGTMMYTPPKVMPHIAPAPGGWIDNWVTIFLADLSPGSSILSLGDKLRIFRPENPNEINRMYETINRELADYSPALASRPQIVAANKCDLLGDDREPIERLKKHVEAQGYEFFELSAATTAGTKELMQRAAAMLSTLPPIAVYEPDYVPPAPDLGSPEDVEIEEDDGVWYVSGPWMDRLVSTVNFTDYESRMYFDKSLRDAGIYERMEALGIRDGDTISICGMTFEYKS